MIKPKAKAFLCDKILNTHNTTKWNVLILLYVLAIYMYNPFPFI